MYFNVGSIIELREITMHLNTKNIIFGIQSLTVCLCINHNYMGIVVRSFKK